MKSFLTQHIENAEVLMEMGDYEAAYAELKGAAIRFEDYRESLRQSVDNSIAYLSTKGCRATPPHPVALPLVKLRNSLTT